MRALIFTGGVVRPGSAVKKTTKQTFDFIIAADSGAKEALILGIIPQIVIGDYDSLDNQTLISIKKSNTRLIKFSPFKNETDTELAIQEAIKRGAKDITVIGGIEGDRIDHILANISLLNNTKISLRFISGNQTIWQLTGPANVSINGNPGDLLSLIPMHKDATGITTNGLAYALKNEALFFGKTKGTSNEFTSTNAEVKFQKGTLLIIHTEI